MYSSEYPHTGYPAAYPPPPPQPPAGPPAASRHEAVLAGPAGAPYEQWRGPQEWGAARGYRPPEHVVHRAQEPFAHPAPAPHRTQDHHGHRPQEQYAPPPAPHRTPEHHMYSGAAHRPHQQEHQQPLPHHHQVLPAAPHRTQPANPHPQQPHQSLPHMTHAYPRHEAYKQPAFSFKQPLPTYPPHAASHAAPYQPPTLHHAAPPQQPPQPHQSRLQYHPTATPPSSSSSTPQYPYRQAGLPVHPEPAAPPPQQHHPSIIQYNPQYGSQPYPQRPASAAGLPLHPPDGPRHLHAQPPPQPPPRPHSVQPQPSSSSGRPQPPLTPHPSYPHHHPSCSCPACRPADTPYARAPSFPAARASASHHAAASTSAAPSVAASAAAAPAPAPPSAPPRLECEVPAKRMRTEARVETASPVDLSVRTVRRSADSTAWRAEAGRDGDVQNEACDSTAPPSRTAIGTAIGSSMAVAVMASARRTAVMPRVPFVPDFSVAHFYQQREEQDQLRRQRQRQREDEERLQQQQQQQQVSLPAVGTLPLPWPAMARPSLTAPGAGALGGAASATVESSSHAASRASHSHSALLPRFSSNRSSLYPSSSAPALPPHAADPTGYLLPSLRSLPLVPPLAPPDAGVAEAPRIRTKAEMKMLGDAAIESVRSWLASSQPEVPADASDHPCEASTSGLSAPPLYDEHLLDSAEATARAPLDAVLAARYSVLRSPGQDSGPSGLEGMPRLEAMEPAAPTAAPAPSSIPVSAPVAVLAPAEGSLAPVAVEPPPPEALLSTPTSSSVLVKATLAPALAPAPGATASASALPENVKEEGDDSQGAWAQSCLDFELQLGASETKNTSKGRFHGRTLKADASCDKTVDLNSVGKLSVSPDSSKNEYHVSRGRKTLVSRADSSKSAESQAFTRRKPRTLDISDSDSSESSGDSDDLPLSRNRSCRSSLNQVKECPKSIVQTRSAKSNTSTSPDVRLKRSIKKEIEETKNNCCKKLFSTDEVSNKSPRKTRSSLSKESSPSKRQRLESESSDESITQYLNKNNNQNTPVETRRIRLRTKVVEVEKAYCLRPKGDGSDFRPGWEEEVFQYKRSIRMPHILINMSKGSAVSEPDNSKPSSVCSVSESAVEGSSKKRLRRQDSEVDLSSNCLDVESEDAASSVSLPFINNRGGRKRSIIDQLVEKVSKASGSKNTVASGKNNQSSSGKSTKPTNAADKTKSRQANANVKEALSSSQETNTKTNVSRKKDSIRAVFGAEKSPPSKKKSVTVPSKTKSQVSEPSKTKSQTSEPSKTKSQISESSKTKSQVTEPSKTKSQASEPSRKKSQASEPSRTKSQASEPSKTKSQVSEENKKSKSKSALNKKKTEIIPLQQMSLRKRNLVIPKSGRRSSRTGDIEGIVLRPRNAQQVATSRTGLRTAALVKRSKVVLNLKHKKSRNLESQQSQDETDNDDDKSAAHANEAEKDEPATPATVVKKRVIRRKFRSGFDYIRKKKRVRKEVVKKAPVEKEKVAPVVDRIPLTEEQIQVTLRNWVINRSHGDTVLHRAARLGYAEVAQYAIDKLKMSPCVADNAGYTPLHEAARRGHVDLSKILLEHGADVSCSAIGGIRPLHEAAESNEVEMLRLLLEYGADPTLATYANETPLSIVDEDSAAHELLTHYLADVQGLSAPPWKYNGPSKIFDLPTYKGDIALQSPPSFESDADSEINVFSSEVTPPPLYTFFGEPASQVWVLVRDLMKVLNISTEEELFCRLAVQPENGPTSSQNIPTRSREVTVDDFLQKTKAVTFPPPESNLPLSGCMARLVEFSNEVRALLNEEVTTILG